VKRARGFSLAELLVGLALAGLVTAGAFQLHLSFSRQSQRQHQIGELQQTMRVAMQLLERAVRAAGRGLPPTHALTARIGGSCVPVTYYGVQFSNDNTYNDPKTTFWDPAVRDSDPDWLRVVAADEATAVYAGRDGDTVRFFGATPPSWQPGDLLRVVPDELRPPSACALASADPFEVDALSAGRIAIRANGCYGARLPACAPAGAQLRRFAAASTVYRVDGGKLTMRTAPFGTPFADATHPWIAIADGIEDLQIAVVLADGTICSDIDDPRACDFARAAAVQLTLTARPPGTVRDASAPRSITSLVQLRNYAP
jgi:prepilin-type N-terminal cleavage/methylation domain-containing protein